MAKRLFDRLPLFRWARFDVTIQTRPSCFTQRRYTVNLLDMGDPTRLRDEAVVTLHELLDLGVRGHFVPPLLESRREHAALRANHPPAFGRPIRRSHRKWDAIPARNDLCSAYLMPKSRQVSSTSLEIAG